MTIPTKFFMVASDGPSVARHWTREDAEMQARRLAFMNSGVEYYVMEAQNVVVSDGKDYRSLPTVPAAMDPAKYLPLRGVQFPLGFSVWHGDGSRACPAFMKVENEHELGLLLYHYEPSRLQPICTEGMEALPRTCNGLGSMSVLEFETGLPDDYNQVVCRRRRMVPRLPQNAECQ